MENSTLHKYWLVENKMYSDWPTIRRYNIKTKVVDYYNFINHCFVDSWIPFSDDNIEKLASADFSKEITEEEAVVIMLKYGK